MSFAHALLYTCFLQYAYGFSADILARSLDPSAVTTTVTSGFTGSRTGTTTLSEESGTVAIEILIPSTTTKTVTSGFSGSETATSTFTYVNGTVTVEVLTPTTTASIDVPPGKKIQLAADPEEASSTSGTTTETIQVVAVSPKSSSDPNKDSTASSDSTSSITTSTETETLIPVSKANLSPTSITADTGSYTDGYTPIPNLGSVYVTRTVEEADGSHSIVSELAPLEVQTEVFYYSNLNTSLTVTTTVPVDPNTEIPLDGYRCVGNDLGQGCPQTPDPGPLYSQDQAAFSSKVSACERTFSGQATQYVVTSTHESYGYTVIKTATDSVYSDEITTTYYSYSTYTATSSPFGCCGLCTLSYYSVDVYYFPGAGAQTACVTLSDGEVVAASATASAAPLSNSVHVTPVPQIKAVSPRGLHARVQEALDGETFVNSDGYTFISPSVYVGFSSVKAYDECGQVGSAHTHLTLGFAPGELSTASGGQGQYELFWPAYTTLPLDINDLTCGIKPVIYLPSRISSVVDPAWSTCNLGGFSAYDPPFALTPQKTIGDPPESSPAAPAPVVNPIPGPTAIDPPTSTVWNPAPADPVTNPVPAQPTASTSPPAPGQPADPGQGNNDPGQNNGPGQSNDPAPVPIDPGTSVAAAPAASPGNNPPPKNPPANDPGSSNNQAPANNQLPSNPPAKPPQQPAAPVIVQTVATQGSGSQASIVPILSVHVPGLAGPAAPAPADPSQSLGSFIARPFGTDPAQPAAAPVITIGGQAATVVNPSAIAVGGSTIVAGGGPAIIGGQTVSVDPGKGIQIGNSVIGFPTLPAVAAVSQPVATVAGQVISSGPDGVNVDGTALVPGGATVTINNTPVFLNTAGDLVAGSSTIPLPTEPATPPTSETFATLGSGEVLVAGPTGEIDIDGTPLIAGAPTTTIDGTPVALGTNGLLVVGASTISVPASAPSLLVLGPGTTLTQGGGTSLINGTSVFYGTQGLVVGTSTIPVTAASASISGGSSSNTIGLGEPFAGSASVVGWTLSLVAGSMGLWVAMLVL